MDRVIRESFAPSDFILNDKAVFSIQTGHGYIFLSQASLMLHST
jgi:hypothetical protein